MLYDSLLNRSHQCRLTRNPVDHAILFSWVNGILGILGVMVVWSQQTADRFYPKYRLPVGRQWTDSRPTVGNVSVTCR